MKQSTKIFRGYLVMMGIFALIFASALSYKMAEDFQGVELFMMRLTAMVVLCTIYFIMYMMGTNCES